MNRYCNKCFSVKRLHRHHIIYEPEKLINLCEYCHGIITSINTKYAKKNGKLSNATRKKLFRFFEKSELSILSVLVNAKKFKRKEKRAIWGRKVLDAEFKRRVESIFK